MWINSQNAPFPKSQSYPLFSCNFPFSFPNKRLVFFIFFVHAFASVAMGPPPTSKLQCLTDLTGMSCCYFFVTIGLFSPFLLYIIFRIQKSSQAKDVFRNLVGSIYITPLSAYFFYRFLPQPRSKIAEIHRVYLAPNPEHRNPPVFTFHRSLGTGSQLAYLAVAHQGTTTRLDRPNHVGISS